MGMVRNTILYGLLIVFLLVIVGFLGFSFFQEEKSFDILDNCGRMMNLISHTVASEEMCTVHCRNMCETKDLTYSKVEFTLKDPACNECTCYCT